MGGIYIDMEAFKARMVQDAYDLLGEAGIGLLAVALNIQPRRSFWQKLKDEIAARPRVWK
jgi:hypothetical protein